MCSLFLGLITRYRYNVPLSRDCSWPSQRGKSPLTLATTVGEKETHPVSNTSLYQGMTSSFFQFITGLKSIFLHTCNHTEHSHAQNTTALQSNVYLTGIQRLLVKNKGRAPFPCAHNCQIKLHTSQSVSVGYKIQK
jgi:hypothetical protein